MKQILISIIMLCGLVAFLPNEVHAQAHEIKIASNQDPDSMYIMLTEHNEGKYRQGRGKWFNYLDWLDGLMDTIEARGIGGGAGGFFVESTAAGNVEQDADENDFSLVNAGDIIFQSIVGGFKTIYLRNWGNGDFVSAEISPESAGLYYTNEAQDTSNYIHVGEKNIQLETSDTIKLNASHVLINGDPIGGGSLPYYELAFTITKDGIGGSSEIISNTFPGSFTITNTNNWIAAGIGIDYDDCATLDCDGDGAGNHRWFIGGGNSTTFLTYAETTFAVRTLTGVISGQSNGALIEFFRASDGSQASDSDTYTGMMGRFIVRFYPE